MTVVDVWEGVNRVRAYKPHLAQTDASMLQHKIGHQRARGESTEVYMAGKNDGR